MNKLFWGLLLVYLDIHITFADTVVIGLLPDFVGYMLIMQGCDSLLEQGPHFFRGKAVAFAMVIYSVIDYVMDLLNLSGAYSLFQILWGLAGLVGALAVSWQLFRGVQALEKTCGKDLQGEKLHGFWLVMAVFDVLAWLCAWIPVVNTVAALAMLAVSICFIVLFYQAKKLWEQP